MRENNKVFIVATIIFVVCGLLGAGYMLYSSKVIISERSCINKEKNLLDEREINKKIDEKIKKISSDSAGRSLTPDEVAFILNPRREILKELGLIAAMTPVF